MLLEPQRTNQVSYSDDFSQLASQSNITITDNQVISPDGTLNAASFIDNSTNGFHRAFTNYSSSIASGQLVSHSIFAKAKEHKWFQLSTGGSTNDQWANFDLENGVIGNSSSSANPIIENYGNGWYRCILFATTSATNASLAGLVTLTNNLDATSRSPSYSGSNGGVYVFGLQIEQGSYPTSYIPTQGSASTRIADVCNNSGSAQDFNDSEGVLFVNHKPIINATTNSATTVNNGTANRVYIGNNTADENLQFFMAVGGSSKINVLTPYPKNAYSKIAFSYKSGNSKGYVNGFQIFSDNVAFSDFTNLNKLSFNNGSIEVFKGSVKEVGYYDTILTDEELEYMTSYRSLSELVTELKLNTL